MKRRDLIAHMEKHNCELVREGSRHSFWQNKKTGVRTAVPRHREINDYTARAICTQLGIPLF